MLKKMNRLDYDNYLRSYGRCAADWMKELEENKSEDIQDVSKIFSNIPVAYIMVDKKASKLYLVIN